VQLKETLLKCSQFANVHSQCIHYKATWPKHSISGIEEVTLTLQ